MMKFSVLDTVVLNRDIADKGLHKGDVGAIAEIYGEDSMEVEFVTGSGTTQALVVLNPEDIHLISDQEILSARKLDAA